jgi:flagellar biosynthesis component FlhA
MKNTFGFFVVAAVLLIPFSWTGTCAQHPPPGHKPPQGIAPHHNRRDEVSRMVDTIKIWKITEELDVGEDLAQMLFPRIRKLEKMRKEFHITRLESINQLKKILETVTEPTQIEKAIQNHKELIEKSEIALRAQMDKTLEILTPEQQLRFLILDDEFPHRIREFMRQHRQKDRRNRKQGSSEGETGKRDRNQTP